MSCVEGAISVALKIDTSPLESADVSDPLWDTNDKVPCLLAGTQNGLAAVLDSLAQLSAVKGS